MFIKDNISISTKIEYELKAKNMFNLRYKEYDKQTVKRRSCQNVASAAEICHVFY